MDNRDKAEKRGTGNTNEIEIPLIYALLEMENSGIKIDIKFLDDFSKQLDDELFKLENEIVKISGKTFNVSSPKQLGEVLFDYLKLTDKPKKTKSGQDKYIKMQKDGIQFLKNNSRPLYFTVASYMNLNTS